MGAYWRVVKSLELTGNRPRLLPTPAFRVGRVLPHHYSRQTSASNARPFGLKRLLSQRSDDTSTCFCALPIRTNVATAWFK